MLMSEAGDLSAMGEGRECRIRQHLKTWREGFSLDFGWIEISNECDLVIIAHYNIARGAGLKGLTSHTWHWPPQFAYACCRCSIHKSMVLLKVCPC